MTQRAGSNLSQIPTGFLSAAALFLLTFATFWSGLSGGRVWDDISLPMSRVFTSPDALQHIWTNPAAAYGEEHYWPVVYTAFWLQLKIWGSFDQVACFKLFNLLLHALNSFMLWCILRRLHVPAGWFAAALFAVHPVHVESVTWMIELKDCLSGFFYFAAALAFFDDRAKSWRPMWVLSLLLFAAGMLTKTIVVTLPVALLLLTYYRAGKITRNEFLGTIPFFIVGLTLGLIDWAVARSAGTAQFPYSLVERIGIASTAFWFYLGKLICPYPLHPDYLKWKTTGVLPLVSAIGVAGFFTLLIRMGRKWTRGPLVCFAFFGVTLGPVLGIIPFSYMQFSFAADRYLYLAAAGPVVLVAAGASVILNRLGIRAVRFGAAAGFILIAGLGVYSAWLCKKWYTNETLFSHVLQHNPGSQLAHQMLGIQAQRREDFSTAAKHMNAAMELNPDDPMNYRNLAVILVQSGKNREAKQVIRQGLLRWPADQKLLQLDHATSTTEL